jgi:hypothetical protein
LELKLLVLATADVAITAVTGNIISKAIVRNEFIGMFSSGAALVMIKQILKRKRQVNITLHR